MSNKVFLNDLPKNGDRINWKESIGHEVKFTYEEIKGELRIVDYNIENYYLDVQYLNNDIFNIFTGNFVKCKLGKLLSKYSKEFKIEIGATFKDDKRDLTIIDREYKKDKTNKPWKWYKYTCNKCNWEDGWIVENALIEGNGCSCCGITPKIVVEGINDIPTTAPWMVKYFQGGYDEAKLYTKSTSQKINPVCPDCKKIKDKKMSINDIYTRHSIACTCGDGNSYPNKFISSVFSQLNTVYELEYSPEWIFPKRYDLYFELDNKKHIVEADGRWHSTDNNLSGKSAKESKVVDDYKDLKAQENNVEVIRIDCSLSSLEYIKQNIVTSKLNKLFDLSNIDWLKCEEFASSNLIKVACDYKKNNSNLTTKDIGELMKLSSDTIRNYLKRGSAIGWCYYNAKEEKEKINKKVICLNTLEIFETITSAENKYIDGKKSKIGECCKGNRESCGIHPITEEKLKWMFYDKYLLKV